MGLCRFARGWDISENRKPHTDERAGAYGVRIFENVTVKFSETILEGGIRETGVA